MIDLKCTCCNNIYKRFPSQIRNKNGFICKICRCKKCVDNCKQCNKEIEYSIKYPKRFCSQRCSAIFNNKHRDKKYKPHKTTKCPSTNCNNYIEKPGRKFCSRECYINDRQFKKTLLPFSERSYVYRKRSVLIEQNNKCLSCNISEWNGKNIVLEIDHIDGNTLNNERDNYRALCPNCHSQTHTFRGKNKSISGNKHITELELIEALKKLPNIKQALEHVGLQPKGGNYKRANRLIIENNLHEKDLEKIKAQSSD